jgi:hypothetical protein
MTWVGEVGKTGVRLLPYSLLQPLLIPLARSQISLSEPNPSPFTYSDAEQRWWGRSSIAPATPGAEHSPGPPFIPSPPLLSVLQICLTYCRAAALFLPKAWVPISPNQLSPHKIWTPKPRLKFPAPFFKSARLATAGWGPI